MNLLVFSVFRKIVCISTFGDYNSTNDQPKNKGNTISSKRLYRKSKIIWMMDKSGLIF
jgi:hypothetical protein